MNILALVAGALTLASVVVTLLLRLGLKIAGRRPERFLRKATFVHAVLVPLYAVFGGPIFFAWFGSHMIGTRGDERAYAGPRIAADGAWTLQSRESLAAERGGRPVDPALAASAAAATVRLTTDDGVSLRAFRVLPRGTPRATIIVVHGLFRGGLEIETPANMWRDLGAAVLMLEMRNHGDSGRTTPTFGLQERRDVLAAAAYVKADPELSRHPLIVFAVSLGTVAAMRAAPEIPGLAGIVLDAPTDDMLATAHRMLGRSPRPGQRGLALVQPFRSLTIAAVEAWCGFRFEDIRPADAFAPTSAEVPVLLIGGGEDARMPPATIEEVFRRLPTKAEKKRLWIRPGSDHGQVWVDDPAGYREHLASFLSLAAP